MTNVLNLEILKMITLKAWRLLITIKTTNDTFIACIIINKIWNLTFTLWILIRYPMTSLITLITSSTICTYVTSYNTLLTAVVGIEVMDLTATNVWCFV
jgi:hypothetical protein